MREQRLFVIRTAQTLHADGTVTDPIQKRPQGMSRQEWRKLVRKGYRITRKDELQRRRDEANTPDAVKVDRRLHQAGLYSHRDVGRILGLDGRPITQGENHGSH